MSALICAASSAIGKSDAVCSTGTPAGASRCQVTASQLRPLVQQFNTNGNISLGPWYVQPDEFLVSGEALVRNLLLGMRVARYFGGTSVVGYIPDSFGHIAQMPQILAEFGITSAVSGRGVPGNAPVEANFANWIPTPSGLEIHFADYQFAHGLPVLTVPWSALDDLLAPGMAALRQP